MTRRQMDEYRAKAAVQGIGWLVSNLATNFICERFPYPGCCEKAKEITGKAATDFWVALAQAGFASAIH